MEFDFFRDWEQVETVKVGSQLMRKIAKFDSFSSMNSSAEVFPAGHPDEGCEVERFKLGDVRYLFAKDLSSILVGECNKIATNEDEAKLTKDDSSVLNNPQVLVKLLSLVLDSKVTHFAFG